MRQSTRCSDAMHILAYLALFHTEPTLTSTAIAISVETNPTNVRRLMGMLRRGGLIVTVPGRPRPMLARPTADITLLDVYRSVEGDAPLMEPDPRTNPECVVGAHIQKALAEQYDVVQRSAEAAMRTVTLADVLRSIDADANRQPQDGSHTNTSR